VLLPAAAEGEASHVSGMPTHVWVVDDDEFVRDSLTAMLQAYGFDVAAFASGADLLAQRGKAAATCLVIDQHMPGLAGLDVLVELRNRLASPPTILITGRIDPEIEQRARQLGVVAILQKPFAAARLVSLIRHAIATG